MRGRNVINYLPPSVEQGTRNGVADIDVLEATDYYKTPRSQKAPLRDQRSFFFQ